MPLLTYSSNLALSIRSISAGYERQRDGRRLHSGCHRLSAGRSCRISPTDHSIRNLSRSYADMQPSALYPACYGTRENVPSTHRYPDKECKTAPAQAYRACTLPSARASKPRPASPAFVRGRLCVPIRGCTAKEKERLGRMNFGACGGRTYMNKWAVHFEPGVFRSSCATVFIELGSPASVA